MNGKTRLIAAPRSRPHRLGGEYKITGDGLEEDGGDIESSSLPEYCSESEGMVTDDSVRALGRSLEDIVGCLCALSKIATDSLTICREQSGCRRLEVVEDSSRLKLSDIIADPE